MDIEQVDDELLRPRGLRLSIKADWPLLPWNCVVEFVGIGQLVVGVLQENCLGHPINEALQRSCRSEYEPRGVSLQLVTVVSAPRAVVEFQQIALDELLARAENWQLHRVCVLSLRRR